MRSTFQFFLLLPYFVLIAGCAEQAVESQPESSSPVTVFYNADVVTMNPDQPSAESVAVRAGNIIGVGSNSDMESRYASANQRVNLNGKTLLPGFIDAHGHLSFTMRTVAAPNVASPPVGPAKNIDDIVTVLKAFAKQQPGDGWVFGFGYDDSLLEDNRHPTRDELDQVSTERPVGIMHVSGHLLSCNSKCLELASVNENTPNPEGGVFRRKQGTTVPNGVMEETAMAAVYLILPQPDEQAQLYLLDRAQDYYAAHGITTVQDGAAQLKEVAFLRQAAADKRLKLDVAAYPIVSFLGNEDVPIEHQAEYANGFRVAGIKLVLDGSPQGKTAWLTDPYFEPPEGQDEEYRGYPILEAEQVQRFIDQAFISDTPVIAHANGDAAADQLIKAVTSANERYGNTDRRTVMIHAQTAREDQIDAMLENNMMPSYFSAHTFYWGDWHRDSVFGQTRAQRISPLKSSADKGLIFTTHNDTPVVPPDMLRLLWASVNRETRAGKTLGPEQKISPYQALKSVTIDAAYQYFEEDRKGSIEVGKIADFVVLDRNPLKVDHSHIKDIQIVQTIKQGEVIYAQASK